MPKLSIIIPVYCEENNLKILYKRLTGVLKTLDDWDAEILFIDDGSTDKSWDIIEELHRQDKRVTGLSFSRNFGHQYALKAGLDYADGDAVMMMDADMQHPIEMIKTFITYWEKGYDWVYGIRQDTINASKGKKTSSRLFYKILNAISDVKLEPGSSDFRLLDRKVVEVLKGFSEYYLFLRGLVRWTGFKSLGIPYTAPERHSGKSKYSLRKMISLAKNGIMSFSIRPLQLATGFGFILSFFAFLYIIYALLAKFAFGNALPGWTSLLISVLLIGGIQLICLGIVGEYIGKIFMESKRRPHYIIRKRTGDVE